MNNIVQFCRFALCIMYYKFLVLLCVEMYILELATVYLTARFFLAKTIHLILRYSCQE